MTVLRQDAVFLKQGGPDRRNTGPRRRLGAAMSRSRRQAFPNSNFESVLSPLLLQRQQLMPPGGKESVQKSYKDRPVVL
jgi:hypothetical protein